MVMNDDPIMRALADPVWAAAHKDIVISALEQIQNRWGLPKSSRADLHFIAFMKLTDVLLQLQTPSRTINTVSARTRHFIEPLMLYLKHKFASLPIASESDFITLGKIILENEQKKNPLSDERKCLLTAFFAQCKVLWSLCSAYQGPHASTIIAPPETEKLIRFQSRWVYEYLFKHFEPIMPGLPILTDSVLKKIVQSSIQPQDKPVDMIARGLLCVQPAKPVEIIGGIKKLGLPKKFHKTMNSEYVRTYLVRNPLLFTQNDSGLWELTETARTKYLEVC